MFDVHMMSHVQVEKHLFLSHPLKCVVHTLNPYEIFFFCVTEKFCTCKSTWKCNSSWYGWVSSSEEKLAEGEYERIRKVCMQRGRVARGGNEQKAADGEGLGKLGREEESHKEKQWAKGGWLDGGKQLGSEEEREEVRWGDVSRADGLRECRSKFHGVMSLQKQEM